MTSSENIGYAEWHCLGVRVLVGLVTSDASDILFCHLCSRQGQRNMALHGHFVLKIAAAHYCELYGSAIEAFTQNLSLAF